MLHELPARVALITPSACPAVRGNAVTVARIARGLTARGVAVRVWDRSTSDDATIEAEIGAFAPSLVHGFHARHVGPLALRLARRAEIPLVVTLTGTDANHDLFDPERAASVRRVLGGAGRITVFHQSVGERVGEAVPDVVGRLVVVAQSVRLPAADLFDLQKRWPRPPGTILFVF